MIQYAGKDPGWWSLMPTRRPFIRKRPMPKARARLLALAQAVHLGANTALRLAIVRGITRNSARAKLIAGARAGYLVLNVLTMKQGGIRHQYRIADELAEEWRT